MLEGKTYSFSESNSTLELFFMENNQVLFVDHETREGGFTRSKYDGTYKIERKELSFHFTKRDVNECGERCGAGEISKEERGQFDSQTNSISFRKKTFKIKETN